MPNDSCRCAAPIQESVVPCYLPLRGTDSKIGVTLTLFQLTEFARTDELAAVGEQTTLESIDQIRLQLQRLDPQLFC